jgi:RimJ/RimL family protein N-acetyltransferase
MSEVSFPDELTSERLKLQRYRPCDAGVLSDLVHQNRDRLTQSFPEMARELTGPEAARAFIDDKLALWRSQKSCCYGIWLRSSPALIGQIQLKNITWNVPSAELSYFISSAALRQGYASEAIRALMDLLFGQLEFLRIYVRVVESNHASLRLAEALGFRREGLHRQEFRCGLGNLHDVQYLSVLKSEQPSLEAAR